MLTQEDKMNAELINKILIEKKNKLPSLKTNVRKKLR